jgi:hypothetical protein
MSSPYINRFLQPDTIIPNMASLQTLNRFSYVLNNPINASDPSGHRCVGELDECLKDDGTDGAGFPGGGNSGSTPPIPPPPPSNGSGYSGPLPDDISNALVAQGASQALLDSVTIDIETPIASFICVGNQLAVTMGNHVYICQMTSASGIVVYDPTKPTPVLVHELVHVRQFRDDYVGTWVEVINYNILNDIDETREKYLNQPDQYNPYVDSWVESEGSGCQQAFGKNPNMQLDSTGPCNLQ